MSGDLRVCFVGDSFIAGTGDPQHVGWTGRLAARTHQGGQALSSYNLGVRRQTSREVLDRWQQECAPRLPTGCEARVVVSFGVNDTTIEHGQQRVATARSGEHLARLLDGARSRGWGVLVVGPPPVAEQEHNARTAVLDQHLAQVCAEQGAPYAATLAALLTIPVWIEEAVAGDGAHPGAAGYTALADHLWPAWHRWLTSPASP